MTEYKCIKGIFLHPMDHVVTVAQDVASGDCVVWTSEGRDYKVTALTAIPKFHKIAACPLKAGDQVIKYGEVMGIATADIPAGAHVHVHNVRSEA